MIHTAIFMNKQRVPAPLFCVFFTLSLLLLPFSHQPKQTTLFLLLIITFFFHGIWCLQVRVMHLATKSCPLPRSCSPSAYWWWGEMLDRQHWCFARAAQQLPKTWCVINIFPAANAQHCESCYGGNSLCLWQTQNIHNYSGCLLTTLTGWRKEECYWTKLLQLRKAETKLLKYSQNVWQKKEGRFIPDYITVHITACSIHLRDYVLMT